MRPITRQDADAVIKKLHYSGKVVTNTQLHLGVFLGTRLEGAMQFGPSLDRRKLLPLVSGTLWNGFLELNRMAFSENLPRNSESRALGVALRLLRKQYPHIEWIVSFADATQCGDGTIYRAAGFVLTSIRPNKTIWQGPGGETITDVGMHTSMKKVQTFSKVGLTSTATLEKMRAQGMVRAVLGADAEYRGGAGMKYYQAAGFKPIPGYQLRYVYFLNPAARVRLTVPIIPFSEIQRRGIAMYRGQRVGSDPVDTVATHAAKDGSTPIPTLQDL